jgi:hypothetical protein
VGIEPTTYALRVPPTSVRVRAGTHTSAGHTRSRTGRRAGAADLRCACCKSSPRDVAWPGTAQSADPRSGGTWSPTRQRSRACPELRREGVDVLGVPDPGQPGPGHRLARLRDRRNVNEDHFRPTKTSPHRSVCSLAVVRHLTSKQEPNTTSLSGQSRSSDAASPARRPMWRMDGTKGRPRPGRLWPPASGRPSCPASPG